MHAHREIMMTISKALAYALLGFTLILSQPGFSQTASDGETSEVAAETLTVNINTADASSLAEALAEVGPARAQAIIEWREANGPFEDASDLAQVKGISERIVSLNEDRILVSD